MKLISIITPAYNAGAFLEETIKSVQAQTYKNWEMLIVDDCSKDNTVEVAQRYAREDPRVRLIRHEENQGVAGARNTALAQAKGEYVAFLDSDDLWLPEKLQKQLAFMEENGHILTYTAFQRFDSETGERGKVIPAPPKMTYQSIFYNTAIGCLTVMVNRERSGPIEMPKLRHAEDQCTWQSILKDGHTAYGIPEVLALYRVSGGSMTANKGKAARRQWDVYRQYHGFSVVKSGVYFAGYAIHALLRHL